MRSVILLLMGACVGVMGLITLVPPATVTVYTQDPVCVAALAQMDRKTYLEKELKNVK